MNPRYSRSIGTLTEAEIEILQGSKVVIVGCGGLGGTVLELLGRMGVGCITVIDGDVFDSSNLNRQILSTQENLKESKVQSAVKRMALVNDGVKVTPIQEWLTPNNAETLLKGHDLVIDALDTIDTRFVLQGVCDKLKTPLVHGAIGGWYGQVAVVYPGDQLLDRLYPADVRRGIESRMGNPSFTPMVVSALQSAEAIKVLIGRGDVLRHRVLRIDLLENEYTVIDL